MVDSDTFLTWLYVMADDFCKCLEPTGRPGPEASLTRSEVVTLATLGQWARFQSERDFYRYALSKLRQAFPTLPDRAQFNRLERSHWKAIVLFGRYLAEVMQARNGPYEALDGMGLPTRNSKRRGAGWLPGVADIGWSNRVGWYEGLRLLDAVNPDGVITGFGLGAASTNERHLAETLFALRQKPDPRLPSAGKPALGHYVVDKGFGGHQCCARWANDYRAIVVHAPQRGSKTVWSKPLRRWLAGLRQIVETVHDKLDNAFRAAKERPHDLTGLLARMAAKVTLHNFCIWLNRQLGRPNLEFANLIAW